MKIANDESGVTLNEKWGGFEHPRGYAYDIENDEYVVNKTGNA